MKIAVLKLGARIVVNNRSTSGGTGEALNIIYLLVNGGNEVHAYTKILEKDVQPRNFEIREIGDVAEKLEGYDALVVINGHVNFFGGAEDPEQIANYRLINSFHGPVFYMLCDPNLLFKQIWPAIEKKEWSTKYSQKEIEVTRKDIVYLTQCKNTKRLQEIIKKKKGIACKRAFYFPFQKFPQFSLEQSNMIKEWDVDLSYGGTYRGGRRADDMIKFFFGYGPDVSCEMFGNIKLAHFNKKKISMYTEDHYPTFNKPVKYDKFGPKMQRALSTIIIGDTLYKELDDLAQRIYESIMFGNVVFIDKSYDPEMRVFRNEELRSFCYVNCREDVEKRIKFLKNKRDRNRRVVYLQQLDTRINLELYCNGLSTMIRTIMEKWNESFNAVGKM